jgi:hypothetical protein
MCDELVTEKPELGDDAKDIEMNAIREKKVPEMEDLL